MSIYNSNQRRKSENKDILNVKSKAYHRRPNNDNKGIIFMELPLSVWTTHVIEMRLGSTWNWGGYLLNWVNSSPFPGPVFSQLAVHDSVIEGSEALDARLKIQPLLTLKSGHCPTRRDGLTGPFSRMSLLPCHLPRPATSTMCRMMHLGLVDPAGRVWDSCFDETPYHLLFFLALWALYDRDMRRMFLLKEEPTLPRLRPWGLNSTKKWRNIVTSLVVWCQWNNEKGGKWKESWCTWYLSFFLSTGLSQVWRVQLKKRKKETAIIILPIRWGMSLFFHYSNC